MTLTLSPKRRKAIYKFLVAVGALAVVYGLVGPDEVDAWLRVAEAALLVLGGGLAHRHVEPGPVPVTEENPEV